MWKRRRNTVFWTVALSLVLLISYINMTLFPWTYATKREMHWLFWPFDEVRYGYYLSKRFFLPVVGLLVIILWEWRNWRVVGFVRENWKYLLLLLLVLGLTRFYSFGHWFYLDDFRFIGGEFSETLGVQALICCGEGYPAMGVMYLVMRWFGTNYFLYNLLGLIIFYFVGVLAFGVFSIIQKDKVASLLSALFLLTTSTYFHMTIAVQEFTGDGFAMVLFLTSILLMILNFIPGSLLFAVAALEFGLSRTYFISLPLVFIYFFLVYKKRKSMVGGFLVLILFVASSLVYLPILTSRSNVHGVDVLPFFLSFKNIVVMANLVTHVTISHVVLQPLVRLLGEGFNNSMYISPVLGAVIFLVILPLVAFYFWFKGERKGVKLMVLGSLIILSSVIFAPMFGVRKMIEVERFTELILSSKIPMPSTAYGWFPALGLSFVVLALSQFLRKKVFRSLLVFVVVLNIIGFIKADRAWNALISTRQRSANGQLLEIISSDGRSKVVMIADDSKTFFHDAVRYSRVYLKENEVRFILRVDEFMELVEEEELSLDQVYLLSFDPLTLEVDDLSNELWGSPKTEWREVIGNYCIKCL